MIELFYLELPFVRYAMMKQCVAFNLIYLGNLKKDCDVKTSQMLCFRHLMNKSVYIGLNFLLASIPAIYIIQEY